MSAKPLSRRTIALMFAAGLLLAFAGAAGFVDWSVFAKVASVVTLALGLGLASYAWSEMSLRVSARRAWSVTDRLSVEDVKEKK